MAMGTSESVETSSFQNFAAVSNCLEHKEVSEEMKQKCFDSGPELVKQAVLHIKESREFGLATPRNIACRSAATELMALLKRDGSAVFKGFCKMFVSLLLTCFVSTAGKGKLIQQEEIWSRFHTIRNSLVKQLWESSLQPLLNTPLDPIFIQFVSQQTLEGLLKIYFPLPSPSMSSISVQSMTHEEENALRYAAGYIPFALRHKIEKSQHPYKEEFILCLVELCAEDIECSDLASYSTQWVKCINRGGLKEVNNMAYLLCREIEVEVRKHYNVESAHLLVDGSKEKIVGAILANEDVQFQWCLLSVDLDENHAQELLKMIADLWVTMRGFSFAKSWLERYKQYKARNLAKAKSLGKGLQD